MDVLFRKDKNTKEVVAFLPECPVNYGNILCYMHIGQHSEATLQYYWDTVKATEEEYKPLLEESESVFVTVNGKTSIVMWEGLTEYSLMMKIMRTIDRLYNNV